MFLKKKRVCLKSKMKTYIFNFGLILAQFQLFDDDGSILVDGNQYDDFGFSNFGRSKPVDVPDYGPISPDYFGPIGLQPRGLDLNPLEPYTSLSGLENSPNEIGKDIC